MGAYLIIGASSGIGKATAEILLEEGHNVYGTYNSTSPDQNGVDYQHFKVGSPSQIHIPEILDGLVYAPGAIKLKPFKLVTERDIIEDFRLQVMGAIDMVQRTLPSLKKGTKPSIVFFSTVASQMGFPFHTVTATSKGAIEGLSKSLAAEFAPTIRVNTVAPGLTDTPLSEQFLNSDRKKSSQEKKIPLAKIGNAHDVAKVVKFLLTDGTFITGQTVPVDGGLISLHK